MMTYSSLLERFKADLKRVVKDYEDEYPRNHYFDMPKHRTQDVASLRTAIDLGFQEDYADLLSGLSGVTNIIEEFETGLYLEIFDWGFSLYPTGKSKLKDALEAIINAPQYSNKAFMRVRIRHLENILASIKNIFASIEGIDPDVVCEFKQALDAAQVKNQTLAGDEETLETQNNTLEQENKKLQQQLEQTRSDKICLLGRIERQGLDIAQPEDQATTPNGEKVSMSFGTWGFSPLFGDEKTLETQNNTLEQENKKLQQQLEDQKELQRKNEGLLKSSDKCSSVVQNDAADASTSLRNKHSDSLLRCGLFNSNNPFNNGNDAADALASPHKHDSLPLCNPNNPFNNG